MLDHAIGAAKIAAIRHRDAQVVNGTGEGVEQDRGHERVLGLELPHGKGLSLRCALPSAGQAGYRGAMRHPIRFAYVGAVLALAACSTPPSGVKAPITESPATVVAPPQKIAPVAGAKTAAAFDRTTAEQKAAALSAPAGGAELGRLTVSLGNPVEQGFWLRSDLAKSARPGVVKLANGKTVQVDLLPAAGGGPQLSLAAYRALGLSLTDLPTVIVLTR